MKLGAFEVPAAEWQALPPIPDQEGFAFPFAGVHDGKLIVAGGLDENNVAQAIASTHPWGVDVSTGVESSPGRKDPRKVQKFIANAKAAFDREGPGAFGGGVEDQPYDWADEGSQ